MPAASPAPEERAEELLRLSQKAAGDLVESMMSLDLLAGPGHEVARTLLRERARYLFLFVVLSVLFEEEKAAPGRRETAEALKRLFAAQILETRRLAQGVLGKALKPGREDFLRRRIADSHGDPFAPYYGSWASFRKDPAGQGPFALFAAAAAEAHFEPAQRVVARERLASLAMSFSDSLLDRL